MYPTSHRGNSRVLLSAKRQYIHNGCITRFDPLPDSTECMIIQFTCSPKYVTQNLPHLKALHPPLSLAGEMITVVRPVGGREGGGHPPLSGPDGEQTEMCLYLLRGGASTSIQWSGAGGGRDSLENISTSPQVVSHFTHSETLVGACLGQIKGICQTKGPLLCPAAETRVGLRRRWEAKLAFF